MVRHRFKMADQQERVSQRKKKIDDKDNNPKSIKKKKKTEEAPEEKNDQLVFRLQKISTCFGVSGLFNSKKSKIESKTGAIEILSNAWLSSDAFKELAPSSQKRYIEMMSERSLNLLVLMKEIIAFYDMLQGNEKKHFKKVSMDLLMKDLKLSNTSSDITHRYTQMGLWREVMRVNQEAFRNFDQCVTDDETDSAEKQIVGKKETQENRTELDTVDNEAQKEQSEKAKSFRDFYMEVMTSSFADDLDRLREQSEMDGKQVELLVDCLEAGKDIWTDTEKKLFQSSFAT